MKYLNFKWLFASLAITSVLFTACDKPKVDEQLLDKGQHIINFLQYGGGSGTGYANANLSFDPTSPEEKLELNLNYSTDQVSDHDITVTVEYNPDALAAFNAVPGNAQYQKLPDSTYDFPATTVVIKANQSVSESFFVTFFPNKIDGSINYMLPITVKTISGAPADVKAGPSTGTAYLHFIGNPLAGFYDVVGLRRNYTGVVAWPGPPAPYPTPTSTSAIPAVKFAAPLDAFTIQLDIAAIGAGVLDYEYLITADATYANISLDFSAAFLAGSNSRDFYVTNYVAPAPGVKPEFHIQLHYNNGTNDRIMDEYFRHQ